MIELNLDKTAIAVGDVLSGSLVWNSSKSQNRPKKGTLKARWQTEGRGTRDRQIVQEIAFDPEELFTSQGLPLPFSIQIPYEGPITYNGSLIRILWELEAVIEMPGLFAKKDKQTWPIQVICR